MWNKLCERDLKAEKSLYFGAEICPQAKGLGPFVAFTGLVLIYEAATFRGLDLPKELTSILEQIRQITWAFIASNNSL